LLPPAIAEAFANQAKFCRLFGAPLTAAVCEASALAFDETSATGRAVAAWAGDPMADALMMRVTGGWNALVRAGRAPELAPLYPPAATPPVEALVAAMAPVLADPVRDGELAGWLAGPPQTNEVARSGVLMPGLMVIAAATGLPLRLFELGASAGLNLNQDRFGYRFRDMVAGDPASPVQLAPDWTGPLPPDVPVRVIARAGVDISPLDVTHDTVRDRLLAYVWPDQPERVARAEAAIALARRLPPPLTCADAADWVAREVAPQQGSVAVVYHSIAFQYFPDATKARIAAHLAGLPATAAAPVAWLRYEVDDPAQPQLPTLRLTLWRGAEPEERLLARAHPHGTFVQWA
jgi:hypothetical protein